MNYNSINKLASAIRNDINAGIRGFHHNMSLTVEQIEDEIIQKRLNLIKQYSLKGILPVKDLYLSINCIDVDCKDLDRCRCKTIDDACLEDPIAHFEIPLIINDYGNLAIDYIGSTDRMNPFMYYTSTAAFRYHKYRKRGKNKPYIWIDTTPNENGMYDCFIFNAPLLNSISISAIFKDPRQLERYSCCVENTDDNMSFIDTEIKKLIVEEKIRWYRSFAPQLQPNDLQYTAG